MEIIFDIRDSLLTVHAYRGNYSPEIVDKSLNRFGFKQSGPVPENKTKFTSGV